MSIVTIDITDILNRVTLKALLESSGHIVQFADDEIKHPDIFICDNFINAIQKAKTYPALLLATMGTIPQAIKAMEEGVFGYILLPFQPGEAPLMVRRALESTSSPGNRAPAPEPALLTLAEIEQQHIIRVLRVCNNNQAKAARLLGIGRNTLWRKLRQIRDDGLHEQGPFTR